MHFIFLHIPVAKLAFLTWPPNEVIVASGRKRCVESELYNNRLRIGRDGHLDQSEAYDIICTRIQEFHQHYSQSIFVQRHFQCTKKLMKHVKCTVLVHWWEVSLWFCLEFVWFPLDEMSISCTPQFIIPASILSWNIIFWHHYRIENPN